jgi:hypothetical protein
MAKEEAKVVEQVVSLPYRWALGPVFTRFFEEFKDRKIMGPDALSVIVYSCQQENSAPAALRNLPNGFR